MAEQDKFQGMSKEEFGKWIEEFNTTHERGIIPSDTMFIIGPNGGEYPANERIGPYTASPLLLDKNNTRVIEYEGDNESYLHLPSVERKSVDREGNEQWEFDPVTSLELSLRRMDGYKGYVWSQELEHSD